MCYEIIIYYYDYEAFVPPKCPVSGIVLISMCIFFYYFFLNLVSFDYLFIYLIVYLFIYYFQVSELAYNVDTFKPAN